MSDNNNNHMLPHQQQQNMQQQQIMQRQGMPPMHQQQQQMDHQMNQQMMPNSYQQFDSQQAAFMGQQPHSGFNPESFNMKNQAQPMNNFPMGNNMMQNQDFSNMYTLKDIQQAQGINYQYDQNQMKPQEPEMAQQQQFNMQADPMQIQENMLMKFLLEKGDFNMENLTPELLQALQQLPLDDNIDSKIEDTQTHQLKQLQEQLKNIQQQMSSQLGEYQNNQHSDIEQLQMQLMGSQDPNKLTEEQLINLLQTQELTVEQIQELASKGLDLNQLQLAGLANNQEQELYPQFNQVISNEERMQILQQELLKQYPNLSSKEIQDQFLNSQFDPLQQQALKLAEIYNNEDQVLIQNNNGDANKQNNMFATPIQKNDPNMSENEFNIDDKLNEEERLRDVYFEQQLRILFKNMMERLPNSTMEKISKKSKQFCEQINKVQLEAIQKKKQKKKEAKQKNDGQSQESTVKEPGEEFDADSSFYSVLYGENSTLNPDPYINEILNCLNTQQDLKNQFKRFLPEDEDEIQEMQQKLQNLQQSMAFDEVPMGTELDRSYDEQVNINKLKRDAYHNLFKLLSEYEETKEKSKTFNNQSKQQKTVNESLNIIGLKIMKVAETYQKYVNDDIKIQLEQNKGEEINYLEYLEKQMSMILSIIPQEIIDSYNVSESVLKQQVNKKSIGSDSKNIRTRASRAKQKKGLGKDASDEEDQEESSPDKQIEESERENEVTVSEQDEEMQEEAEEEFEEEMEEEIEEDVEQEGSNEDEAEAEAQAEQPYRVKSLMSEMAQRYPMSGKELSKHELRIFECLHKQMKSEIEWMNFCKLLLLYIDGVIGIHDLFTIFQEKYGHKVKEELQQELELLLPTRDHNRRHLSDLLKPWNDHEHQKFEKIYNNSQKNDDLQKFEQLHDLSYFKIDETFPLPICSARDDPVHKGFYQKLLNNRYLSLSMGLENFKFKLRNANEEMIFKNEDDMYKLDTQIEMFEKCRLIIDNEIKFFDDSKNQKQLKQYEFPINKLKPLMFFWEKRYKEILIPMLMMKPLKKEFLVSLQQAIGTKLTELQNYKLDQMSTFQDVFRKNFNKSLDHRSFLYKDFIKKYQQKQTHMTKIKEIAEENNSHVIKSINLMKGGNHHESPYFHSFDTFLTHDFILFDGKENKDFPINMEYPNVESLAQMYPYKFPHQRIIMKDQEVVNIVIKLICMSIKFSNTYHNNDRPRLIENLRFLMQDFLQVSNFKQLNQSCGYGRVDALNARQVDMLMNKDCHFYYKMRSVQMAGESFNSSGEVEKIRSFAQHIKPLVVQITKQENSDTISSPVKSEQKPLVSSPIVQKQASEIQSPSLHQSSPLQKSELSSPEAKIEKDNRQELKTLKCSNSRLDSTDSQFLPHFDSEQGYKLLYSPYNVFMFLKFFHAIYERILKAKELIDEKVIHDLSEIQLEEKKTFLINDKVTGNASQKHLDTFMSERYEYFIKGIFTLTTNSSQVGSGFLSSVGGLTQSLAQQSANFLDQSKFEDLSRILLGKNAFLLFQIDKLLNQALKQLQQMHNDNQCQKSFKIFKNFNNLNEEWNENIYLTNYAHEAVEKFSFGENLAHQKSYKRGEDECGHTADNFEQGKQGLDSEQRQTRSETNPQASSISALNQNNFQVFRLLYSPISKVLSVHYINFNSYGLQIQNFRHQMKDNYSLMRDLTHQTNVPTSVSQDLSCDCKPNYFVQDSSLPPVFLKRNLKAMLKHRQKLSLQEKSVHSNNLQLEIVPQVNQLVFTPAELGEDIFIYKDRKTNLFQEKQTMILQDLEKQVKQNNNILTQLTKIQRTE